MIDQGTYTLDPSSARLLLTVPREGIAKKVGHDLVLEATRWNATIVVDGNDPAQSTVTGTADPASFEIVGASGGVKPLSDKDRKDIQKNIEKTLQTDRYREIAFRSTSVQPQGDTGATVQGELTLAGTTRPVEMQISLDGGGQAKASMTVQQTQWGIKPFSAMMGALKVRDAIDIEIQGSVPAPG